MSTTINVTVDDGGLPAKNRQQTAANRQAFVQGRASQQAAQQGVDQRAADRRAAGLDPATGRPLTSAAASSRLPRIEQEPAANRRGGEALSIGWALVAGNSWFANLASTSGGYVRALQSTYTGTNEGRAIYVSSTDGTFWLEASDTDTLNAPEGFGIGDPTSRGVLGDETYRLDRGSNIVHSDIFPIGGGNFVLTLRIQRCYTKAGWVFSETGFPPVVSYSVGLDQTTPIYEDFKSFFVGQSIVREIDTPANVKTYFDGKYPGLVLTRRYLRRYVGAGGGTFIEASATPDPSKTLDASFGSVAFHDYVQSSHPTQWATGWWNAVMDNPPVSDASVSLRYGSPAVFYRASQPETDWPNYFAATTNGIVENNINTWRTWFAAVSENTQAQIRLPLAYYIDSQSDLSADLSATSLSVYQSYTLTPTGYQWESPQFFGLRTDIPPTDTTFWKPYKTLTFSSFALARPEQPSITSNDSANIKQFHAVTDWGKTPFCRGQLSALGFSAADLTP